METVPATLSFDSEYDLTSMDFDMGQPDPKEDEQNALTTFLTEADSRSKQGWSCCSKKVGGGQSLLSVVL